MTELVLIKLGGSLITDKRREACARPAVIERLASEIAAARPRMAEGLLIGHGSGSFGHVAAARHGLGRGPAPAGSAAGVGVTRHEAARLNHLVIEALLAAGLPTYAWAPGSSLVARAGKPLAGNLEPLFSALDLGLLPVVYGDVVLDRDWRAVICSTETVLSYLVSRLLRRGFVVRRLLWLGETDGIYDRRGELIPRIDPGNYRRVRRLIDAPAGTDVTGGMLLRLTTARKLARQGIESWIVNGKTPGLLTAGLLGEDVPGTRVVAEA